MDSAKNPQVERVPGRRVPRLIIALALGVIALLLWFVVSLLWPRGESRTQRLADGTMIELSGLQIGRTNVFTHGTWLSKTLGRFAPAKGIAIAGFKLVRPTTLDFPAFMEAGENLTVQLRLRPGPQGAGSLLSPPFFRKYRLLISGDDNFDFVEEFSTLTRNSFQKQDDGLFAYVHSWNFPRDTRWLRFRLESRDRRESSEWHELAGFVVKNPNPAKVRTWNVENSPRFKLPEGIEVEVGDLTVREERIHPTDIWEEMAMLPVRITKSGQVVTNWGIRHTQVNDASGNIGNFIGKLLTNDWILYRTFRPLDPAKPWRIKAEFGLDSDFPSTNLYSFTVNWPLTGMINTNLGGFPVQISFVNQDMLSVELTNKPAGTRLTLVAAEDSAGNNLDDWIGSWGQHSLWKSSNYPSRRKCMPPWQSIPTTPSSSRCNLG